MANLPKTPDVGVLVLTLQGSVDRQARIKQALDQSGIEFEFFWGVDGRKDQHSLLDVYDDSKRMRTKGQPMTPGQLGCFASHFEIWAHCDRENKNFVVLEDDVVFDEDDFKSFLDSISQLPAHFECLRLFENKTRNHKRYELVEFGCFRVLRYTKGPMSTMGYYLTPRAARKFLASTDPVFLPVDIHMDRYWVNGVACLGIKPAFVSHDYGFASLIGYEKKGGRRPMSMRLNREFFTLSERVRRFFYNLGLNKTFRGKRGE
ncbi:glycosyltransferase family 25 protein [Marinobacter sp.]|uniref:glycosyltransferase family 25 protein n=1 Tax=Marinobacter sp. TaxID=50741 RepID=UPI0025B9534C|nr:glycosyltransferase family 25 protein [Marinobacter sp.]